MSPEQEKAVKGVILVNTKASLAWVLKISTIGP